MLKPSDIQVSELPYVDFDNRIELPKTMGIYFVLDKYKNPIYIGKSINIRDRWTAHHKLGILKNIPYITLAWLEITEVSLLNQIEMALIQWFQPPLNKGGRGKKDDPNYKKLCGLIPKELFNDFKKWCIDENKDLSEGIEYAVTEIMKPKK